MMLLVVVMHYLILEIIASHTQMLNVKQYALQSQIVWDTILQDKLFVQSFLHHQLLKVLPSFLLAGLVV